MCTCKILVSRIGRWWIHRKRVFVTLWTHLVNHQILRDPLLGNILISFGMCDQTRHPTHYSSSLLLNVSISVFTVKSVDETSEAPFLMWLMWIKAVKLNSSKGGILETSCIDKSRNMSADGSSSLTLSNSALHSPTSAAIWRLEDVLEPCIFK